LRAKLHANAKMRTPRRASIEASIKTSKPRMSRVQQLEFASDEISTLLTLNQVVPRDDHQSVKEDCVLDGNSVGEFLLVYRLDLGKNRAETKSIALGQTRSQGQTHFISTSFR
jgi:hypothetical protein